MEKLLTIEQVAEALQVKKSTIYSLVCRKRIPHVKLTGKILRFKLSELQKWIESANCTNTISNHAGKKAKNQTKSKGTVSTDQIDRLIQQARKDVLNE
jgi:excisionase family DNA binding protein